MKKLLVANWKENPVTEQQAMALFEKTVRAGRGSAVEVVVCPPVIYLEPIAKRYKALRSKKNVALGAQDVFWENKGAFTGADGPRMLRSLGAQYVIIGHSERRNYFGETDAIVNKKVRAALAGGLKVILCVGEPSAIRKQGVAAAKKFIKNQLTKDLNSLSPVPCHMSHLIIAYEPIWAIGTGKSDTPDDAVAMAIFIRRALSAKRLALSAILYGGSINGNNIRDYVHCNGIDGALVGGASLDPKEFGKIIQAATSR